MRKKRSITTSSHRPWNWPPGCVSSNQPSVKEGLGFRCPEGESRGQCSRSGSTSRASCRGLRSFGTGSVNGSQRDPGTTGQLRGRRLNYPQGTWKLVCIFHTCSASRIINQSSCVDSTSAATWPDIVTGTQYCFVLVSSSTHVNTWTSLFQLMKENGKWEGNALYGHGYVPSFRVGHDAMDGFSAGRGCTQIELQVAEPVSLTRITRL